MNHSPIYITSATQISMQQPLSEAWLANAAGSGEPYVCSSEPYVRSIEPDFRQWLSPMASRRMGRLMKRTLVAALKVMADAGVTCPDAIITGTGLGCIENTELLLDQLTAGEEETLKPTWFMQSTHNTLSSLIAIHTCCHGYNTTYSHRSQSFDAALLDAVTQLCLGDITNALVVGTDEMTPTTFTILRRTGMVGQPGQVPATEATVAMLLTTEATDALCQVESLQMTASLPGGQQPDQLLSGEQQPDMLVMGHNGLPQNDAFYDAVAALFPGVPRFDYKRLFGEGFSAPALGLYAAAHLLRHGRARRILFVNRGDGPNHTFITLSSVS